MKKFLIITAALTLSSSVIANTGYEEPTYLNYAVQASKEGTAIKLGRTLENGVFEPGYLNYQFDQEPEDLDALLRTNPPAAGPSTVNNTEGYVEPIYVNYDE
ncbi:hypothetical protein ACFSJ3_08835 [Corallincola platygyrae]|uniref:Uncharacterized protein n=1 Tax=Corallincola platygyrae TaxID=1193278 RepID=A0ABW4XP29_9GAMM